MKNLLAIPASLSLVALLGGCAGPQQSAPANWGYQPGQQAPRLISEAEAETLTTQVGDLKAQRRQARNNLVSSGDAARRAQWQAEINNLTERLQPLEYRLRAAGRPVPRD